MGLSYGANQGRCALPHPFMGQRGGRAHLPLCVLVVWSSTRSWAPALALTSVVNRVFLVVLFVLRFIPVFLCFLLMVIVALLYVGILGWIRVVFVPLCIVGQALSSD